MRAESVSAADDPHLRQSLERDLKVDCSGRLFLLPLLVNRKAFGLFLFSGLGDDFEQEVELLVELMKRVACKLQIFHLVDYVAAPL